MRALPLNEMDRQNNLRITSKDETQVGELPEGMIQFEEHNISNHDFKTDIRDETEHRTRVENRR